MLPAVLPVSMLVACFVGLLGVRWKKQWMLWSFSFMSFLWFLFCLFLDLIYSGALTDLMPWDTTSMQVGFGGYITTFFQDEQGGGGGSNTGAQVTASLVIYSLAGFLAVRERERDPRLCDLTRSPCADPGRHPRKHRPKQVHCR